MTSSTTEKLQRQIGELEKKLNATQKKLEAMETKPFVDLPIDPQRKILKAHIGLPVFSSVPTYKGFDGEMVLVDDGSNYMLYTNLDGSWQQLGGGALSSSARAYLGTDQTGVSNLTWTKVELDSENWDTRGEMDTTTNHRFTATDAGKYLVVAGIAFSAAVTTYGWIAIYVNGAQLRLGPKTEALGGKVLTHMSTILDLEANDYVELWGYFNSDGTEDIESGANKTYLEIAKL